MQREVGFSAGRGVAPPAFQAFALESPEIVAASFGIAKASFGLSLISWQNRFERGRRIAPK